jgi:hypothetical protein
VQVERDRARFLQVVERIAPELWPELEDSALAVWNVIGERDGRSVLLQDHAAATWAKRHNLDAPWVIAMALDRLALVRDRHPWSDRWLPPRDPREARRRAMPQVAPPEPFESAGEFAARVKRSASAAGFEPDHAPIDRDLERLARWQLGASVEALARGELAGRTYGRGARGEETRARALRTRAEDVRDVVKRLGKRLGLPARPPARAGRRRAT